MLLSLSTTIGYFNPRPREEGDAQREQMFLHRPHFNPRPREEGDQNPLCATTVVSHFNPRPREEGDT